MKKIFVIICFLISFCFISADDYSPTISLPDRSAKLLKEDFNLFKYNITKTEQKKDSDWYIDVYQGVYWRYNNNGEIETKKVQLNRMTSNTETICST